MRTFGNGDGLTVRLCHKGGGAHVRNPNLDRPQALLAEPLAMRSDLIPRRLGASSCCHSDSPIVTCNLPQFAIGPKRLGCTRMAKGCNRITHGRRTGTKKQPSTSLIWEEQAREETIWALVHGGSWSPQRLRPSLYVVQPNRLRAESLSGENSHDF